MKDCGKHKEKLKKKVGGISVYQHMYVHTHMQEKNLCTVIRKIG